MTKNRINNPNVAKEQNKKELMNFANSLDQGYLCR